MTSSTASRLAPLDGLRGLAAFGVAFLYHPLLRFSPELMGHAVAPVLWLRDWGWTFVDLFFVISGYIFAQVYLQERPLGRAGLSDFTGARIARLYPLHLLMLLTTAIVFASDPANTWTAFLAHLFMMQVFVEPVARTFDGPSWSISVEVVCYAMFAWGASRSDRALRIITGVAIGLAMMQLILLGRPGGPWVGDSVPRGVLGFFVGQLMWRDRGRLARIPSPVLALVMIAGFVIDMGAGRSSLPPLCLLAWPATLCLALRVPLMGSRALVWLGDRSYAIYLIHVPLLALFIPWMDHARTAGSALGAVAAFAGAVLMASELVYRYFERPAQRLIRSAWAARGARATDAAVA